MLYKLDAVKYDAAYRSAVARLDNAKRTLARLEPLVPQARRRAAGRRQRALGARVGAGRGRRGEERPRRHRDSRRDRGPGRSRASRARRARDRPGRPADDDRRARSGLRDVPSVVAAAARVAAAIRKRGRCSLRRDEREQWRAAQRNRRARRASRRLAASARRHVNFMAPSLDSASGTQEFRAEFTNGDRRLLPGQFVRVRLEGFARVERARRSAARGAAGTRAAVRLRRRRGRHRRRARREPGPWSGSLWIIDSGLVAGDRVVVDGMQKVAPGRVVKPGARSIRRPRRR